ncbi:MAG: NERD domain-containing protein/DEAD/DEAH box helicase [Bacteroidota bacterium]
MPKTFPPIYYDPNFDKLGYDPKRPNAEKLIYDALQQLSDDYYVFHSYRWQGSFKERYKNGENDFMVYHPKLGILIIEVKGGAIEYVDTQWQRKHKNGNIDVLYGSKDPIDQVLQARGTLLNIFKQELNVRYVDIPITFALWFPNSQFDKKDENLPAKPCQILDQKTLLNPGEAIKRIFAGENKENKLSKKQVLKILFPTLNIVSSFKIDQEYIEQEMIMLTKSQSQVLDFTEEQNYTAIRGGAGTGKTVIAEEKVRRLQKQYAEDKILFLCFNKALKEVLEKKFENDENVNAINYDSLVLQLSDQDFVKANYGKFDILRDHFYERVLEMEQFPYQHIVIDEAQDFNEEWIELLSSTQPKHFYLFYDRNQDIFQHRKDIPKWMIDIDCRLSLHTNCRNTKEIAHFANKYITNNNRRIDQPVLRGIESSKKPHIVFYDEINTIKQFIGQQVADWQRNGVDVSEDTRIVTVYSSRDKNNKFPSITSDLKDKGIYYKTNTHKGDVKIPIISAGKIKGLESNYIFLIDVLFERYADEAFLRRMYVASSRAKHELYIFIKNSEKNEVKEALVSLGISDFKGITTYKQLANKFAKTLGCTHE